MSENTNMSESNQFPKKDQAIVLEAIDEIKLIEYVEVIGNVVSPKNILFASRISNNRVFVYLSDKDLIEDVVLR